jgi:hypothetical protein
MARCKHCGKAGIFLKVNENGICKDCQIQELSNSCNELNQLIDDIGARETLAAKKKTDEYNAKYEDLLKKCYGETDRLKSLEKEIETKKKEIIVLDEEIMLESFALYKPKFKFMTSEEYKKKLETIRDKQKDLVKTDAAVHSNNNWTVNGSAAEGRKMIKDMKKLLVRAFNNECDYCVDNIKFNNFESSVKRIDKSFDTINKLGKVDGVEISIVYKNLKFDELCLAYEYQQKKQEEKEEARRVREELREQQKLEREIKEARERIAKERKHFSVAIKDLETKLKDTTDAKERELISKNLEDAKEHFIELDKEEKVIDYREQNAKAGYVYIISNIGSFGENVYKIGMTRRLEPMERVDELGGASVPFSFDVHAMIFSENAPALESKLHEHFYNNRINKINTRKEFFRADINEIERVVKDNYNKVVDVVKEAPAQQYREGLLVEK